MFPSLGSLGSVRHLKERSISARRSSLEERRRPLSDFGHEALQYPDGKTVLEEEQGEQEDLGEEIDEDGDEEMEPLLPVFSAAQLGITHSYTIGTCSRSKVLCRCFASIQSYAYYPALGCFSV